jgi:hypothetical protein
MQENHKDVIQMFESESLEGWTIFSECSTCENLLRNDSKEGSSRLLNLFVTNITSSADRVLETHSPIL